jgi:glycosyltransferase involved in cell wall biosynthesis
MDKSTKLKVYYDNCIFTLQEIGGISIVFGEIIKRLLKDKSLSLEVILNGNDYSNIIFNDFISEVNTSTEIKINKKILPFFPLMKVLPSGSIYHSTYNRYSFQSNIKRIITIHDLGYEKGIMRAGIKRWVHLVFKKIAIRRANAIICVSQNTRDDLEHYYSGILHDKLIKVIYNGLSEEYFSAVNTADFNKNVKYILYVGSRHAYKNFDKVVVAVSEMKGFELFICGGGQLNTEEINLLNKYVDGRYSSHINITNDELKNLYANAFCLVYPSSYEGFGLPVLEAMACGCPVIACDNSSIPEIAGNAAVLIPEAKVSAIKEAVANLLNDTLRLSLIELGKINAGKFSWGTTAAETSLLYKQISST